MKNLALKTQLEGLRDIGLDRVNNAVAAVFAEVVGLEDQLDQPTIDWAREAEIGSLKEQNALLRAELAAVRNAIENPTPPNAEPSRGVV